MRQLIFVIAAAIGISTPGQTRASVVPAHAIPPSHFVLRLTDMPAGFTQTAVHAPTNPQADKGDHLRPGTVERHGRIAGYEVDYQRSGFIGLLDLSCTVVSFRATSGAAWQLQYSLNRAKKGLNGAPFVPMSVGQIGNKAAGYQWTGKAKGIRFTTFIVVFRRGTYSVAILGAGLANAVSPDSVLNLSHIVDGRILHAR
jgi:hypothetical protein